MFSNCNNYKSLGLKKFNNIVSCIYTICINSTLGFKLHSSIYKIKGVIMVEMGYYNYYNNEQRLTVSQPHDRYKEMVAEYNANSDSLHHTNEDPYSEKNIAVREFEEKLAVVAADNRSKCATVHDVYQLLGQKYFGKESSTYMDRLNADEATRAMYDNELNATLYGTYQNSNPNDPRINWNPEDWETQELKDKASNQKIISSQMANILSKNNISLASDETLLISFNPYSYEVSVQGLRDSSKHEAITQLLNDGKNSQELFYYTLQNSGSVNQDAITKYKAYQNIKDLTGEDLSQLTLKDGNLYTDSGTNILRLVKDGIEKDSFIPNDFKRVAYDYSKDLLRQVAQRGFNSMPDLDLTIGYSQDYGFFSTSNIMYVA